MEEEWKWIKGYEGIYQISNLGNVKSFHHSENGKMLSIKNKTGWYLSFRTTEKDGTRKTLRVHQEVAKAFIGDVPKGFDVHHKDENKQNNAWWNLEIIPRKEHLYITMSKHPEIYENMNIKNIYGNKHVLQYTDDGYFVAEYANAKIAEKYTGVCSRNILQVANKETFNEKGAIRKQAGGYVWRFGNESEVMKCSN